jgi:hypothetical protein
MKVQPLFDRLDTSTHILSARLRLGKRGRLAEDQHILMEDAEVKH